MKGRGEEMEDWRGWKGMMGGGRESMLRRRRRIDVIGRNVLLKIRGKEKIWVWCIWWSFCKLYRERYI